MNFSLRKKRAGAGAKAAGVDGILITHLPDVRYLCGFTGSSAVLALVGARATLFTDGRYTVQARAEAAGTKVVIAKKPALVAACEWLESSGVKRCGFDAAHTTVTALETMRKALSAKVRRGMFVAVGPVVARMREVKDADEIELIRAAALVGCDLFDGMLTYLEAGLTEVEVAATLEYAARLAGAEGMSFDTIVASGERSALPHGRATRAKLPKQGFVTLDFGVILDGYCSDMTRTVHMGKALRNERDVYDSVLEAQEAAVAAVAPGVTAGEVDEAARSVLRRVKLDKYFSHSTGHGVGLEIHEGPRLAAKQTQVLKQGMVITIEPGVYMPGQFGLRIEDMVLVTANGGEVLTPSVKAWIEL
ncbi:M24 family metallopeptidase [Tunturiibacter gelidoferens]|uniref:Xaa-Pro aminopeptidase n=1 Tax=Tunturiibacter gelidiferens TaxID=3069689 RepID=A0ACC5NU96_9BACT|nr:Xaa-Pro peptidase family protein [Edaphobacter lichenicola]MBB5338167.1 Xaa-Pro aminopeptidase [Edaphobacter lichenicola]